MLDDIANRALEHAAEEVGADGAIALLQRGQQGAYSASFGLSQSESERELVGLPPSLNDARAVTIRYRYSAEEVENDAFRLTGGLAVPLEAEGRGSARWPCSGAGQSATRPTTTLPASRTRAALLASPLENARRFEETRHLADLDPATGLQSERYFADRLLREVARARRYDRRLALVLFCLGSRTPATDAVATFGRQLRARFGARTYRATWEAASSRSSPPGRLARMPSASPSASASRLSHGRKEAPAGRGSGSLSSASRTARARSSTWPARPPGRASQEPYRGAGIWERP